MRKFLLPLMIAATSALFLASLGSAAAPPNKYGQQCYKGAWATLYGTTGAFASQDACVAYVSKGGTTYPIVAHPTFGVTITGPVQGLGALIGNPQSRTAGGITDPAMQFNISGSGWVTGQPVSLSYTAGAPLSYTYANPTSYFPTAGSLTPAGSGSFSSFFQDNCFDNNNVLVSGLVPYTVTATGGYGQTATATGNLNCDLIGATVLASANTPAGPGWVKITGTGWHFTPLHAITLTYSVLGTNDGSGQVLNNYFTVPNADANGSFAFDSSPYGDNCIYDTGSGDTLQTGTFTFTMTATDGTHTATATGTLDCSKLGT